MTLIELYERITGRHKKLKETIQVAESLYDKRLDALEKARAWLERQEGEDRQTQVQSAIQ